MVTWLIKGGAMQRRQTCTIYQIFGADQWKLVMVDWILSEPKTEEKKRTVQECNKHTHATRLSYTETFLAKFAIKPSTMINNSWTQT